MTSWKNSKLTKWQVTKWQVDKMASWQNDIWISHATLLSWTHSNTMYGGTTFLQFAIALTWHSFKLSFCNLVILYSCHIVLLSYYQLAILSTYHLSTSHFFNLPFHQHAILSNWQKLTKWQKMTKCLIE